MKDARIKLLRRTPLQQALTTEIDAYFERTGQDRKGGAKLARKTAFILAWWAVSWAVGVSMIGGLGVTFLAAVSLGMACAGIGFCIMHDGNHRAFSTNKRVNLWMGAVLDLVGGSSYVWRQKHNVMHHTYPNIVGADDDIDIGALARMAPDQPRHSFHALQHFYMWFLYGFITIKWHWWDDFSQLAKGHIGGHKFPRPKGRDMAIFVGGRIVFFAWALFIPMALMGFWPAVAFYFTYQFILGVTLAVVFQLAHCVEEADFPSVATEGKTEIGFAELQLATTVDFARHHPFVTWYLGGLNFQAVHHLDPSISHIHYPAISKIVERVCAEHGVAYRTAGTFRAALASHYRWLRRMGQAPVAAPVEPVEPVEPMATAA